MVAVVLAAAGVAHARGLYSVETKTTEIPGFVSGGVTVSCPDGSRVTGGGFAGELETDQVIIDFFPPSGRKFSAVAQSFDAKSDELTGYAVCDESGPYTVESRDATVPGDDARTTRARCPRGSRVSGGGVNVLDSDVEIIASRPAGRRAWLGESAHYNTGDATHVVYAICDQSGGAYQTVKESGMPPPARHARRGIDVDVTLKPPCPAGSTPTGGGYDSGDYSLNGTAGVSRPAGNRWRVTWETYAGKSIPLVAYARCKL